MKLTECKRCGSDVPKDFNAYCSHECRIKYHAEQIAQKRLDKLENKVCPECDTVFKNPRAKYCSPRCAKVADNRREQQKLRDIRAALREERNCDFCGTPFMPRDMSNRFCTRDCGRRWHNKKLNDERNEKRKDMKRPCRSCSTEIEWKKGVFYCQECWKIRHHKPEVIKRQCEVCEKEFATKAINKTTCSKKCWHKRYYRKNKAKYAARMKRYYAENTDKCKELAKKNKRQNKVKLREYVERTKAHPCHDCGLIYPPPVMEFDHVRGEKLDSISSMASRNVTLEVLREEIAKCDLICANCHRIRTMSRVDNSDPSL